jgi:hypothetical protein
MARRAPPYPASIDTVPQVSKGTQHAQVAVRNIQETSGRMRSTVERFKV